MQIEEKSGYREDSSESDHNNCKEEKELTEQEKKNLACLALFSKYLDKDESELDDVVKEESESTNNSSG